MPDRDKKITIYDVAKHAGVAPGTVSRTVNNIGYIKEETRKKVAKAVSELKYIPNKAGRSLKTTKSDLVCLAIPDTSNPIYFRMIESVLNVAKKQSYSLLLYYTNGKEEDEIKALRLLQENTVDALFLVHFSYSQKLKRTIERCTSPIVLCGMCNNLWAGEENRNFDTISIDIYKGIYTSVEYLINKGHKEIVYLAGKKGIEVYEQRYRAYRRALKDYDIDYKEENVFWHSYDERTGQIAAKFFEKKGEYPKAVCASNDLQAIGFCRYFKSKGVRIQNIIDIIGVDNLEISELLDISSLDINEAEVGKRGAEFMFERMHDYFKKTPAQDVSILPKLVIRNENKQI